MHPTKDREYDWNVHHHDFGEEVKSTKGGSWFFCGYCSWFCYTTDGINFERHETTGKEGTDNYLCNQWYDNR